MVSNDGMKGKGERETRVPEIRFRGFSGVWEEKRLAEIVNHIIDNRGKILNIIVVKESQS